MKKIIYTFAFFLLLTPFLAAQVDLENGQVAYYPFSANLKDASSLQNNAADSNDISFVTGRDGTPDAAVFFDGTSDAQGYGSYIEIPDAPQLNYTSEEQFAISFWMIASPTQNNVESTGNDILSKWNNAGTQPYPYVIRMFNETHPENKGVLTAAVYDSNGFGCSGQGGSGVGIVGETPVNDGLWHHVVFTREADGFLRLYVDCNLEGEVEDVTLCSLANGSTLKLGTRHLGDTQRRPFTGTLDELRVHDRALTADERDVLCGAVDTDDAIGEEPLTLFPNPVRRGERFYLRTAAGDGPATFDILTLDGRFVRTLARGTALDLPTGVYLVRSSDAGYAPVTRKLVVTR